MKKPLPSDKSDITLGEQFEAFKKLVDSLPTPVILMAADGFILHVNPLATWLLTNQIGNLVGKRMPSCEPGDTSLTWRIPTPNGTIKFDFKAIPVDLDGQRILLLVTDITGYQKSLHNVSEAIFTRMFDQSNDGIVICDSDLLFVEWNKAMEQLTGYPARDVIGKPLDFFLKEISLDSDNPLNSQDLLLGHSPDSLENLIMAGGLVEHEHRIVDRKGETRFARYRMFPVFVENQVFIGAVVHDITEVRKAEDDLRASEMRFRTLVEAMGEGLLIVDFDLNITFANRTADSMFGAGADYLQGRNIQEFVEPEMMPGLFEQIKRVARGLSARYELDINDFRGNPHTLAVTSSPWRGPNDEIKGSIIVFRDITELKIAVDRLRFSSTHDEVTWLYNRNYYEEEKARLKMSRRYPVSVVMVDMDNLKKVNDTLGHQAGDELLKKFGSIARGVFRREDMIARVGGDEFVVFLPETGREAARDAVERLRSAVTDNNRLNPDTPLHFSIGHATAPSPDELDEAIHRADYRMFREKRQRKAAASG